MLREFTGVRQIPGEPLRRWFSGDGLDLMVWYDTGDQIRGFQLAYRGEEGHKALTWLRGKGVTHDRIDDGEARAARAKMTRVLVPDAVFDRDQVLSLVQQEGVHLDPELRHMIVSTIQHYPRR